MLTASFLVRRVRENLRSDWVLGMLLVAAFFTHMISFCFCGLLVVSYAWQTRRFRIVWQLVPSCLLTIWYVLGRYLIAGNADGDTGQIATVKDYSAAFWAFKVNSYLKSLGYVNPVKPSGSLALTLCGKLGFAGLLAVDLAMAVLVGWCLAWAVRRAYRDRAAERFAWTAALLLLPLYLLIPGNALGSSDPGSRLLQVGLGLAVVLMCRRPSVVLRGAAVCGVVLAAASLAMFFRIAFGVPVVGTERGFPHAVVEFAHAPLLDEDVYWWALDHGDYRQRVFPSGMFLNR
jgi:hypothetical protein